MLKWMGYGDCFTLVAVEGGVGIEEWTCEGSQPSEAEIEALYPSWQRDAIKQAARGQIRIPTMEQSIADPTATATAEQDGARYTVLTEALVLTADEDLDSFDGDLFAYEIPEKEYAASILRQETRNLAWDSELRDAGNGGIFSDPERNEVQARVTSNARVARGLETGARTPSTGAPRGWVTLDGEDAAPASMYEISHDEWAGGTMYHPRVVLNEMPEGVDTGAVYAMVYDADNSYRGWLPFAQRADGKWETPTTTSGLAKTESANWRVAVAYQGTDAESEITAREVIVPPNSTRTTVRWGGRNGEPVARSRRGRTRR